MDKKKEINKWVKERTKKIDKKESEQIQAFKELNELIEKRRRGKGVYISAVFPDELFKKFYTETKKQNRSESNLLVQIVSEHYEMAAAGFHIFDINKISKKNRQKVWKPKYK